LQQQGKATLGMAAMIKAHATRVGRDVCRTAREIQGANGILFENFTINAMMGMEGAHIGEGTYDINILVAGRELTGLAAFK
jgi:alkylation response protein AidB-like acyl-CoA dehydrogenase